jgi:translation initiation factor 3 subunit G
MNLFELVSTKRADEHGILVPVKIIRSRLHPDSIKNIQERANWKCFGINSDNMESDSPATSLGEDIRLKLSRNNNLAVEKTITRSVICRNCQGEHWTKKCPIKPTTVTTQNVVIPPKNENLYVPPKLRGNLGPIEKREGLFTVRVTGLVDNTQEEDVRALFSTCGTIRKVFLSKDQITGYCKGYAFISYMKRSEAESAIKEINLHAYANVILKVAWAQ